MTLITHIPSPYQVELCDALTKDGRIALRIIYVEKMSALRSWMVPNLEKQTCLFLTEGSAAEDLAAEWVRDCDLMVFSWYGNRFARKLIEEREASGRPWCYWGERPGFSQWKLLSRLRRIYCLRPLVHSKAPVWGIGGWAVEAWREEFGEDRRYFNIPYFSDLSRFSRRPEQQRTQGVRTVLFSGALIYRKGIDLLAKAFARVAPDAPHLRLNLLGSGGLKSQVESTVAPCASQVRFLGFRQWNELPDVYHSADVLCAPSRYDGWGMIVPEGLAAGLPVISTNSTGAALELIENRVNGWKITTGDECDLEQVLRTVAELTDAELDKLSEAASATAHQHSLQHGVNRFCDAVKGSLAAFN